jgi:hypothetical protein
MTPYWRLFINAMDDFMLKFLLVCAVVQLVIEVSFADASHRSTCKYSKNYHCQLDNTKLSAKLSKAALQHNVLNAYICRFCAFAQFTIKLLFVLTKSP